MVSNPNVDHATALTLAFNKFHEKIIVYPKMEVICEEAANFREDLSEDSGLSSLTGFNGSFFFQLKKNYLYCYLQNVCYQVTTVA